MIKELYNRLGKIEKLLQENHFKNVVLLNMDEASQFIKMKKTSVYQLIHHRKIPHIKRGKLVLFNKAELVAWLEEKKVDTLEDLAKKVNMENIVKRFEGKDNGIEKWKSKN